MISKLLGMWCNSKQNAIARQQSGQTVWDLNASQFYGRNSKIYSKLTKIYAEFPIYSHKYVGRQIDINNPQLSGEYLLWVIFIHIL